MIEIGKNQFEKPLFMAPMEGITDIPFRKLVRKHGCTVICTQMIHAQGLILGASSRRIQETSAMSPDEGPVGFQLCGNDPEMVQKAATKAAQSGAAFIDINMGCPAKNVVNNGGGAALLKNPDLAARIVDTLVKSVAVPVTVKIRAGWSEESKNYLDVGKKVQEAGACLITVHARTRSQKYTGSADWNLISELKKELSIPVVGNGDVTDHTQIQQKFSQFHVDGVMVGRGALGNPWIFSGKTPRVKDVYETMQEHLQDHLTFYSYQDVAYRTFRKHIVWYTKGLPHSAEFRDKAFKERDNTVFMKNIEQYFASLDPKAPAPRNTDPSDIDED